mgnify:CR=1 FL=1
MGSRRTRGFTIIEVMLFLSISGVLFIGLMIGVSTNINQQRYRDSVTSLAGLLQQQYSEVSNTRNDRDKGWRCEASETIQNVENGQARGTTDCVILGRYIRTIEGAAKIETGDVIGAEPTTATVSGSDIAALSLYAPKVSSFGQSAYLPEWDALLRDEDGRPSDFTILVLRSPESGLIRVFAASGSIPSQLTDMLTAEAARRKVAICVEPNGWNIGGTQAVIFIDFSRLAHHFINPT